MKKPLQGEPIQGGDSLKITQDSYSDKIPVAAFNALEWEAAGLKHGTATLTLYINDGLLTRYVTSRTRSVIPEKLTTGGTDGK